MSLINYKNLSTSDSLKVIKSSELSTIATSKNNHPYCAIMYFDYQIIDSDLIIYMLCENNSMLSNNIRNNKNVNVLFDKEKNHIHDTIECFGEAAVIEDKRKIEKYYTRIFKHKDHHEESCHDHNLILIRIEVYEICGRRFNVKH